MRQRLFEEKVRTTIKDLPARPSGIKPEDLERIFGGCAFKAFAKDMENIYNFLSSDKVKIFAKNVTMKDLNDPETETFKDYGDILTELHNLTEGRTENYQDNFLITVAHHYQTMEQEGQTPFASTIPNGN